MTELLLEQGYEDLMFVGTPTATKILQTGIWDIVRPLKELVLKKPRNGFCRTETFGTAITVLILFFLKSFPRLLSVIVIKQRGY